MTTSASSEMLFAKSFGADFVISVASLFQDERTAFAWIANESWQRRCAALEVLAKFWQPEIGKIHGAFDMLLKDEVEDVRVFSVGLLASPSYDRDGDWADRRLTSIVEDDSASPRLRDAARRGLEMRSHRKFNGTPDELLRDTATLIDKWSGLEVRTRPST